MKLLKLFLMFAVIAAAQNTQNLTIIPSTSPSTGAPLAVGNNCFRDLSVPPKTVCLQAPNSISSTYSIVLNTEPSASGCVVSTGLVSGVATWSISPCSGASGEPFPDNTALLANSSDVTKLLKFSLAGFPTGTTYTLTPQAANYTLAGTNLTNIFTVGQKVGGDLVLGDYSGGVFTQTWSLDGTNANVLYFRDSGSVAHGRFDASAGSSASALILSTSMYVQADSASGGVPLTAQGYPSSTSDILDIENSSGVKDFYVDYLGGTHVTNCVSGCGITSVSATGPITASGSSAITIACANCDTINTAQTITATKTFGCSGGCGIGVALEYNSSTGREEFQPSNALADLGDSSHQFLQVYAVDAFLEPGVGILEWGPSDSANLNSAGGATFQGAVNLNAGIVMSTGANSTIFTGSGGNLYTRLISSSSGVSCSGVPDGWLALAADGYIVACGSGVRSRAALTVY